MEAWPLPVLGTKSQHEQQTRLEETKVKMCSCAVVEALRSALDEKNVESLTRIIDEERAAMVAPSHPQASRHQRV